ncbi:UNVERIFIED_ORG: two-component system OmpR family sensor kinase [Arthrobacter sp. UYEF1]
MGTLNARILDGQIPSGGFLNSDTARLALDAEDKQTLLALTRNGFPVDRSLSNGDYRIVAVDTGYGDILVTGLPLAAKESTLTSLVWTFVFVSLGGLSLIGLAGTVLIRRTMKPLEQLSEVATRVARLPLDAGEVALAVRVPPSNSNPGTEVGSVGHTLNLMLDNVANALEARQRSETKVRQFVADASHELRTPLTAIRGYTELMRMTEDFTPDGRKSLARVQSQSERMTTLVGDLLLLARLDEGQPLKLSEVDLTQLVIETVSDEKVIAPDHRWRLELTDEPLAVTGDASQLRQVLVNLLSNARKHTPPGTTVVTAVTRSADGSAAVVTVTDDGGGIPAEFVDHVFSRFARADAARRGTAPASDAGASEGTSGLGLSIVQSIMAAHGGSVAVTSRAGQTELALLLPAGAVAQPAEARAQQGDTPSS